MSYYEVRTNNKQDLNFKNIFTLQGHTNAIASVKFHPDGTYLASSSYDNIINVWNVSNGTLEARFSDHKQGVSETDWSPNGSLLVSASDDKSLKLWNIKKKKCEKTLKGHKDVVFCARFCANPIFPDMVASGSDDRTVKLWDAKKGRCTKTISDHIDRIVSVDFNKHAAQLLSASHDGNCFIYDLRTHEQTMSLVCVRDNELLSFARFSPNGKYILTSSIRDVIRLWNVNEKRIVKTYQGHQNLKYCLYSSFFRGQYIVSGSEDNCVCIWDINSFRLMKKLEGHKDAVLCVDSHPTENIIASGGLERDMTVKIWKS